MIKYLEKEEDFKNYIKEEKVLVDFYADWCGPCKMLGSIIEDLEKELTDILILKINVDNYESIAKEYKIMSIPTLILFEKGNQVNKHIGFLNPEELKKFVEK